MTSYEKQRLEELGFMNEMLARGVPADHLEYAIKMARCESRGVLNKNAFESGFENEVKRRLGIQKKAAGFDDEEDEDLIDKLKRYGLYAGIGTLGMAAGYAIPKVYNSTVDVVHRMSEQSNNRLNGRNVGTDTASQPALPEDSEDFAAELPDDEARTAWRQEHQ